MTVTHTNITQCLSEFNTQRKDNASTKHTTMHPMPSRPCLSKSKYHHSNRKTETQPSITQYSHSKYHTGLPCLNQTTYTETDNIYWNRQQSEKIWRILNTLKLCIKTFQTHNHNHIFNIKTTVPNTVQTQSKSKVPTCQCNDIERRTEAASKLITPERALPKNKNNASLNRRLCAA